MALRLEDSERRAFLETVYATLEERGAKTPRSDFLDGLALRAAGRAPEAAAFAEEDESQPPPARGDAVVSGAAKFAAVELLGVRVSEIFPLLRRIAEDRDDAAFSQLLEALNDKLKIKGILFRRGLDPEREYPGLWSKIWEAIWKWDGRDFVAYVGRVVRNYCVDDLKRRKKAPGEVPDEAADARPSARTTDKAASRDALGHVLSVIDDLEADGSLAPIDGVIFALLTSGRAVQDIERAFQGSAAVEAISKAIAALSGKKRLEARDALALRFLLDGLEADEVAVLSGRPAPGLALAAKAVAKLDREEGEELLLARALAREGLSRADVDRARKLSTNAINLRINRARLKVWMALADRSYDALRRRGAVDEVDLAIVQHRCTAENGPWCRMYKDRSCKRERSPAEIARLASLPLSEAEITRRVDEFREKILDGLGRAFPDYDSCLNERKPDSRGGGVRPQGQPQGEAEARHEDREEADHGEG